MSIIVIWGITLIASLSGQHVIKGMIAGFFGLLLGTVGYGEAGVTRGTLGISYLLDGVPAIPAMMGMFAASELFRLVNTKYLVDDSAARKVSISKIFSVALKVSCATHGLCSEEVSLAFWWVQSQEWVLQSLIYYPTSKPSVTTLTLTLLVKETQLA